MFFAFRVSILFSDVPTLNSCLLNQWYFNRTGKKYKRSTISYKCFIQINAFLRLFHKCIRVLASSCISLIVISITMYRDKFIYFKISIKIIILL